MEELVALLFVGSGWHGRKGCRSIVLTIAYGFFGGKEGTEASVKAEHYFQRTIQALSFNIWVSGGRKAGVRDLRVWKRKCNGERTRIQVRKDSRTSFEAGWIRFLVAGRSL